MRNVNQYPQSLKMIMAMLFAFFFGVVDVSAQESYYVYDNSTNTMTYYYDSYSDIREAELASGFVVRESDQEYDSQAWIQDCQNVVTIVFDESFKDGGVLSFGGRLDQYIFGLNLTSVVGLENLDLSRVTSLKYMFDDCSSLTSIDLSCLDTSNITDMSDMFRDCSSLTTITWGDNFSTANVTDMHGMFKGCSALESLDLTCFDTHNVTNMGSVQGSYVEGMFENCSNLTTIIVGSDWSTENVTTSAHMFTGCTNLVGGAGTVFNSSKVTAEYAHVDGGTANPGYLTGVQYVPYVVFDETAGTLTFYADGKQTEKVGTIYNLPAAQSIPDWANDNENLRKVVFAPSFITARPTSLYYWFANQNNLEDIEGLENLITSEVTNMESLFQGCVSLTTLDLTIFDTHNVTNMSYMFWECRNLQTIYVGSGWTTENVANNSSVGMFYNCFNLEGSAGTMWDQATHGGEVPVKQFAHVDGGAGSPGLLSGKTEAYVHKSADYQTVTFYYDAMRLLRNGTTYELNTVTNSPGWYSFRPTYVTTVIFDPSFAEVRPTSTYQWFYNMTNLSAIQGLEYLNTSEVTTMHGMFYNCSSLTTLDLSSFDTQKVTDFGAMFRGCTGMQNLKLFSVSAGNSISFNWMFGDCASLEVLDLSSFNTASVYNMTNMFSGCSSLTTIYVSDEWDASSVVDQPIFTGCTSLVGGAGTHCDGTSNLGKTYAIIDGGTDAPGYLTQKKDAYAVCTVDPNDGKSTLTFYYDTEKKSREGTVYELNADEQSPAWRLDGVNETVKRVVFDASFADARPTTTYLWFYGMKYLTAVDGIEYLNTSEVTNMHSMFNSCFLLEDIDVTGFNTEKVVDMRLMFAYCYNLNSIDVTGFDTRNVRTMFQMFFNCRNLEAIDVSHFETDNLRDMSSMFLNCSSLKVLDLSNFNTENVGEHLYGLVEGCSQLEDIDLSSFNTSNVVYFDGMFDGCRSLKSINLSNFNTENAESFYMMFSGCTSLESIDLSNFNTKKVNDVRNMFNGCSNLTTILVGDDWSMESATEETDYTGWSNMFLDCTSLVGGKGTAYDASHVDGDYAHLDGGTANPGYLTSRGYAVYDPGTTTLTFYNDGMKSEKQGTVYELNSTQHTLYFGEDPAPEWLIDGTYSDVTKVVFDASFASARPNNALYWFGEMANLTSIEGLENLNTSNVTNMQNMFSGCQQLESLNLSHFNTERVENMNGMFYNCSNLETLDLSSFNTRSVIQLPGMFQGCIKLTAIFAGDGWNIENLAPEYSNGMFQNCTSLVGGMGTAYDASHVDGDYAHIDGGTANPGYLMQKTAFPMGDINNDGKVTIADVTALSNLILGKPGQYNRRAADVNLDGEVTIADLNMLVDITLGKGAAYVDLGLPSGTLWATCNIGASSPEEIGDYFAWGETSGYNAGKASFDWSTYKWCDGTVETMTKYNTTDGKTELDLEDDAAYVKWGPAWRMPSIEQFAELVNDSYTTAEFMTLNGVNGLIITSKRTGMSIFLPNSGMFEGSEIIMEVVSFYWSRSLSPSESFDAATSSGGRMLWDKSTANSCDRYNGLAVRPVRSSE